MSFISPAAHQKFIIQCQNLIEKIQQEGQLVTGAEKTEGLKKDLAELQQLLETYLNTISRLPDLAREYKILQRRIRINARRIQPVKRNSGKNNFL